MLLVSDDFILDLESMNHKLTNTMLWPSKYISLCVLHLHQHWIGPVFSWVLPLELGLNASEVFLTFHACPRAKSEKYSLGLNN